MMASRALFNSTRVMVSGAGCTCSPPSILLILLVYFFQWLFPGLDRRLALGAVPGALSSEYRIEHPMLAQDDGAEKLFLRENNGLQPHHLQHRQQRADHGRPRRAGLEKFHQLDAFLRTQ